MIVNHEGLDFGIENMNMYEYVNFKKRQFLWQNLLEAISQYHLYEILLFSYLQVIYKMKNGCRDDVFNVISDPIISKGLNFIMISVKEEAKKVLKYMDLKYIVIYACFYKQFLYYSEVKGNKTKCPKCSFSQYCDDVKMKNVPKKKIHYFSLSPCLLIYRSLILAKLMMWWYNNHSLDCIMKILATWQSLERFVDCTLSLQDDPWHMWLELAVMV